MKSHNFFRFAFELALLIIVTVYLLVAAFFNPNYFLNIMGHAIGYVLGGVVIFSVAGILFEFTQLMQEAKRRSLDKKNDGKKLDNQRAQIEKEREQIQKERDELSLQLLKILFPVSRAKVSDEELQSHKADALHEVEEAKRLRDSEKPPRLGESADHFALAYQKDGTLWQAGIAAAVIWINMMSFEKARVMLERIKKDAKPGSEQKWAAELNLGTLWNRKYLAQRKREENEKGNMENDRRGKKEDAERALEITKQAHSTLKCGKINRQDAEAITIGNLAAYYVCLDQYMKAIELLKEYRGKQLSKSLLEKTFEPEEIKIMLSIDPDLNSFFNSLDDNKQNEKGQIL
jgi:hypothetical protein